MGEPMSQEEIYTKLSSAGFAPHQAAGIVGNLEQESSLNPTAVNPKSGAYGLAQWLGPRKDALHQYAVSIGGKPDDLDTQIGFLVNELNTTEREASKALAQTKTPQEAAAVFSRKYERAGANESRNDRRVAMATKLFEHIIGKYVPGVLNTLVPAANAAEKPTNDDDGVTWEEYIPATKSSASATSSTPASHQDDDVAWEEYIPANQSKPVDNRDIIAKGMDAILPGETPFSDFMDRKTPEGKQAFETAARVSSRALASPLSFGNTLLNLPYNAGVLMENVLNDENHPYAPNYIDEGVNKLLERYDIPTQAGSTKERVATAALSAATGAGAGKAAMLLGEARTAPGLAALGRFFAASPEQQIAGASGSAAASDMAADMGYGALGQGIAGAAGGIFGGSSVGVLKAAGGGAGRIGNAMTEEGKRKTAGRILYRQSSAPEAAIARLENPELNREIIPGSRPYTAEVTQDPGQAFGVRAIESSELGKKAGVGGLREARMTDMDRSINEIYDKVNRVPKGGERDIIWKLRDIKRLAFDKFAQGKALDEIAIDEAPLMARFDELYKKFQGNTNITNALARVEQALKSPPRTVAQQADDMPGTTTPRTGVPINRNVDVEKDDVITAIRKMGGLTRDEWGDMDITRAFGPDPRGPVFAAAGNKSARGLDDMTSRLIEHGYLPPGSRPVDLEELLTDISTGVADDSRRWSAAKSSFADRGPRSSEDAMRDQFDTLVSLLVNKEKRAAGANTEPSSPPNFQRLWNARKELDNAIYGSWKDSDSATRAELARVGEELRADMNRALVAADPDFEPFLRRYSFAAQMEDRLRMGRELARKTQNASRNMPTGDEMLGDRKISAAKSNNLDDALYTDVKGELSPLGQKLSPRQLRAFDAAILEKQRGDWLNTGGGPIGSPTAPYLNEGKLLADDIVGGILGDRARVVGGGIRSLMNNSVGRLADYALRAEEPGIMRLLAEAHANPAVGLELLKLGRKGVMPQVTLKGVAKNVARTGGLAELYSILGR